MPRRHENIYYLYNETFGKAGQEPKLFENGLREEETETDMGFFLLWLWDGIRTRASLCKQGLVWFETPIIIKGRCMQVLLLGFLDSKQMGKTAEI